MCLLLVGTKGSLSSGGVRSLMIDDDDVMDMKKIL